MLKEKNSAGGGKFKFFNLSKEKDNELAESVNVKEFISYLKDKIINEKYEMTREEAIFLSRIPNNDMETLNLLFDAADQIREAFCGKYFDLCTIINAKSGKCSENCKYCAQSSHFKTGAETYGLVSKELALCEAQKNEVEGAHRFSLVTSGRGENTDKLELCASHGICTKEALQKLADAGVLTYHHNLESSRRFYPNVCTSHTYDDRINTIKNAKAVGLDVCSGGIFGLGETIEDRIDMALDLRELEICSVPINVLTPIPGTPFENNEAVEPLEILKTISIYRFIMPETYLRYGGGRIKLGDYVKTGLRCGINSALTGNFLTTTGTTIEKDKKMIEELGYEL